jgi:hypothetical protein
VAALSANGLEHADPVGIVLFDLAAGASRIAGSVKKELAAVTEIVPLLNSVITHRQGPAAAASRLHLLPWELESSALARGDVDREVARKFALDFERLFDEVVVA